MHPDMDSVPVGEGRLVLVRGDITETAADAIVNAANAELAGGGGVDGAIHRKGGPAIPAELKRIREQHGGCATGHAVATSAGRLPAKHVIHAVGPVWHGGRAGEEGLLRSAYLSSLEVARRLGARTVAFPSISTGAYRFPIEAAARIAIEAAWGELGAGGFDELRFVLFSAPDLEVYRRALSGRRASSNPGDALEATAGDARPLYERLLLDRVILDTRREDVLEVLRADAERIARGMDDENERPLMLWTGIPFPRSARHPSTEWCLVISVGGTKTEFALMRLDEGEPVALDAKGAEARGPAAAEVKRSLAFPTPTHRETADGLEMVERIVEPVSGYLGSLRSRLDACDHILLAWGFAHTVHRTAEEVLGGLCAKTLFMSKDQAPFTESLAGKDLGGLFRDAFARRLGWSRPVTVANDGIMALHYFLGPESFEKHDKFGLFINGTGTNFAMVEPYAVRPGGVVSRPGEEYRPRRITRTHPALPGERIEPYFVNYETGSVVLEATRTPFDSESDWPIEENALAGGRAFEDAFQRIVRERVSGEALEKLMASWSRSHPGTIPRGPQVSRVATGGPAEVDAVFPEAGLDAPTRHRVWFVCRAIVERSALHAGLLLAAITMRTGFGLGNEERGLPDLLAMEGSVWKTPGYPALVRAYWQTLAGSRPLRVRMVRESGFDASFPGPLSMASLHGEPRGAGSRRA